MCLFPQAFRLIFCLEFFKNCCAVCPVQSIDSVLAAKIKVVSHPLQIITGPSIVYSHDMCDIQAKRQTVRAAGPCQELM